jgi:HD-like signal output (HDOD) protein
VDLEELEEQVFGISHTKAGSTYAEKCNFPRSLALAIKSHHQPRSCPGNALLSILSVANELAAASGVGIEYASSAKEQFEVALKELGLGRRQALSLIGKAPRRVLMESKL